MLGALDGTGVGAMLGALDGTGVGAMVGVAMTPKSRAENNSHLDSAF